jgi:hypothetical protein
MFALDQSGLRGVLIGKNLGSSEIKDTGFSVKYS